MIVRREEALGCAPTIIGSTANDGKVYTPKLLARWVAALLFERLQRKRQVSILDPACGDGELLAAIEVADRRENLLVGVDIDAEAVGRAAERVGRNGRLIVSDAIIPDSQVSLASSWIKLTGGKRVDGVVANPPWGAQLQHDRKNLRLAGYSLAKGQFDSWELFMELSLTVVRPGGVIAFIVPDAIFLPEHQPLRRLIQSRTSILLIARLGEGFFKDVYRGTTVILAKNTRCKKEHVVEAFRLNKDWRADILAGVKSFEEARQALRHSVPQERFCNDDYARWDIDIPESERPSIARISSRAGEWSRWLHTGRGVELSKTGKIVRCPTCTWAHPSPRSDGQFTCARCGQPSDLRAAPFETIVRRIGRPKIGWSELIVGENVDRYRANPGRILRLGIPGINYKDSGIYERKRLLVRKTGVGIKASIIDPGPLTNQVVFHYYENKTTGTPPFYLSYVLGVLCSRIMFAYHLRRNGENEWRSHPYLTQKLIARLPIPLPRQGEHSWKQAKAIAAAVEKLLAANGECARQDERIECLVAGIYEFGEDDMFWVRNVVNSAQNLEPMRSLKKIDIGNIRPVLV